MDDTASASRGASLFHPLRSLELPDGDYAVFASGPLIVRGVIEATNDLDVVTRGAAWEKACEDGELLILEDHDVDVVSFLDGAITVGTKWAYGDVDIDNLIDTADTINGLPFARLEHAARCKKIAGSPKDLEHLRLLSASSYALNRLPKSGFHSGAPFAPMSRYTHRGDASTTTGVRESGPADW